MNTMSKFTRSLAPVVGGLLLLTAAASTPAASKQVVTSTLRVPLQDTVRYRSSAADRLNSTSLDGDGGGVSCEVLCR
ncbi:MAG TPA: hypothetical protein VHJ19_12960 [Gammaproteobacteria bacterium]|nr:hypothetical protein [Gammaproteobacteria bacterium]